MISRWKLLILAGLLPLAATAQPGMVDLRSDQGVMMELQPTGLAWLGPDKLLVCDERYNDLHIFDLTGRRYKFVEFPRNMSATNYSAMTALDDKGNYLVAGSHYHDKNHVRYVNARAVVHKMTLSGESLDSSSAEINYSPDRAFRTTTHFGESARTPMSVQGMAIDAKQKRIFFGVSKPLTNNGTILVYEGLLEPFLARDKNFALKELKTDLKPEIDPTTGTPYELTDLAYVQGEGLVVLLASQSPDGKRFGSNQLWMLRGGFPPPKLIAKDIANGNRACGVALRQEKDRMYTVALTFDNDPEETGMPSRLLVLPGVRI